MASLLSSFSSPLVNALPVDTMRSSLALDFEAHCDKSFSSRRSPFVPSLGRLPKFSSPTPSIAASDSSLPPLTPSGESSSSNNSSDEDVEILGTRIHRSRRTLRQRRTPASSLAIDIPARSSSVQNDDDDASPSIEECSIVVDDAFGISVPAALADACTLRPPAVDVELDTPDLFHDASEFADSRAASPAPIPARRTSAVRRKPVPAYDPAEFADAALAGASQLASRRRMIPVDLPTLAVASAPASMVIHDSASRSPLAADRALSFARKINGLSAARSQALGWWAHGRA